MELELELAKEKSRKHSAVDAFGRAGKFCIADDSDTVTEKKASELIDKGHNVVGYVMRKVNPIGDQLAFVVGGRCEWFGVTNWFEQMANRGDQERRIIDLENALRLANDREAELKKHDTFEQATKFRDELKCANQRIKELEGHLEKQTKDYLTARDEVRKEYKLRMNLEGALDRVQPQIDALEKALSEERQLSNSARAAQAMAMLELQQLDSRATAKLKEAMAEKDARIKELENTIRHVDNPGNEAFIPGLGTVRACLDCGCLVAGGPTRCVRCANACEAASEPKATERDMNEYASRALLEANNITLHKELEDLRVEYKHRESNLNDVQALLDHHVAELRNAKEVGGNFKCLADSAMTQLNEMREKNENLGEQYITLHDQYVSLNKKHLLLVSQHDGTEELLKKVCGERDSYKTGYEQASSSLLKVRDERNELREQFNKLDVLYAAAQAEIAKLNDQKRTHKWLEEQKSKDNTVAGVNQLRSEVEQLRVQLAGCAVAALGGKEDGQMVDQNDQWRERYDAEAAAFKLKVNEWQSIATGLHDKLKASEAGRAVLTNKLALMSKEPEWRRLNDEIKAQQKCATELFDECKRLQDEKGELLLVVEAAIKKLNLQRFAYQTHAELTAAIERLPVMAPVSCHAGHKFANAAVNDTATPPAQDGHGTCTSCSCKTGAPRADTG